MRAPTEDVALDLLIETRLLAPDLEAAANEGLQAAHSHLLGLTAAANPLEHPNVVHQISGFDRRSLRARMAIARYDDLLACIGASGSGKEKVTMIPATPKLRLAVSSRYGPLSRPTAPTQFSRSRRAKI
jgi:hypothetical protein